MLLKRAIPYELFWTSVDRSEYILRFLKTVDRWMYGFPLDISTKPKNTGSVLLIRKVTNTMTPSCFPMPDECHCDVLSPWPSWFWERLQREDVECLRYGACAGTCMPARAMCAP